MGKRYSPRSFPGVLDPRIGKIRDNTTNKDVGHGVGRTDREAIKNADKDRQKRGK